MNSRRLFTLCLIFLFIAACGSKPSATATLAPATAAPAVPPTPTITATPEPTATATATPAPITYPVVDTGQGKCYDNSAEVPCPASGDFFGQDAQYTGLKPSFSLNNDGTITDNNTGLIWTQSPDIDGNGKINAADKLTYSAAGDHCKGLNLAGKTDWQLPSIKALYSLIDFRGTDPTGASGSVNLIPFIDSTYFGFAYGDSTAGEKTSDSQFASSTLYSDTSSSQGTMAFSLNFAEGRLKAYPLTGANNVSMKYYVLCERGSSAYGTNQFADNGDGTVSDQATGLVWQKADSAKGMDWKGALAYCEGLSLGGKDDWRLPDAKTLQSLVDYTRSPVSTNSAAINGLFTTSSIKNEAGQGDFPYYWTSTTLADYKAAGAEAVYIAFGRGMGYLNGAWSDVAGAGSQRSDPKTGDPTGFTKGRGAQGDAVRILNYARCVRGGNVTSTPGGDPTTTRPSIPVNITEPVLPPSSGGAPSPESIAACVSSTIGHSCNFTILDSNFDGTCESIEILSSQTLFCMPTISLPSFP